jgi:nucleotide-binding universal stress UspA family protein
MEIRGFRSILVPLDGSASAQAALRLALRLVDPDGDIVLVHAIDRTAVVAECVTPYGGDPTPALEALEADQRAIFEAGERQVTGAGVRCSTVALDGAAAQGIVAVARERNVDAIAMGTHGRRGFARIVLGSTAAAVLHEAPVPTFVVHEQAGVEAGLPFHQILVALDGAPAASAAARDAVDLAARDGASVFFAHVVEAQDQAEALAAAMSQARAYALAAGVASDAAILHGDPVDALLICAETCHAGAIAVGAHDRTSSFFGIGSVAEALVRMSPIPVLVSPLPAATAVEPPPVHARPA